MKTTMKKGLSLFLILCLSAGICLFAGCAQTPAESSAEPSEEPELPEGDTGVHLRPVEGLHALFGVG